jgi:malonyl CoA-acyl carrier protein transacylase
VEPFRQLAEHVEVRAARVPVLSCVTAAPFQDVREQLVQAITQPVRWTDVMSALHELGATSYVETGPGRVLTNLVRKSLENVEAEAPLAMEAANA